MGFVKRNLAKVMGYGRDKLSHQLWHNPDGSGGFFSPQRRPSRVNPLNPHLSPPQRVRRAVSVKLLLPGQIDMTVTYIPDGEEHTNEPGETYTAHWDGDTLVKVPRRGSKSSGETPDYVMRRYIDEDGTMVTHLSYPDKPGVAMGRRFVKQTE